MEFTEKFYSFADYLFEENQKMDLTAIKEKEDILRKHFTDSLTPVELGLIPDNAKCIDIGCGAGFPSLPIALARADVDMTCLDSLNKRIEFIKRYIEKDNIKNVTPISARAEEMSVKPEYREQFDIVLSRAVAPLNILVELALPFIKVGGSFICMKGPAAVEELHACGNSIPKLGGKFREIISAGLEGDMSGHCIVIIDKVKNTDKQYPRRYNRISKSPLK